MTGPDPTTPINSTRNEGTSGQNNTNKSVVEGHLSALRELLKEPSNRDLIKPILLDFNDDTDEEIEEINRKTDKGKATQTLDGKAKAWFDKLPLGSIDNWGSLQEKFLNRFGILKACAKDPTEISKIVRKANESLPNFKERWLLKCFSDSIPKIVDEMLRRVDDYVRSKEAFRNTELPKGEFQRKKTQSQWVQKNDPSLRGPYSSARCRPDHRNVYRSQEHHAPYVAPLRANPNFHRPREHLRDNRVVLTLDSLVSTPKEILATEHQLHLPQPPPLVGVPSKENLNKYCVTPQKYVAVE
ncbi:hypothetical protein Tco_0867917 [Tanacetum coccineum]